MHYTIELPLHVEGCAHESADDPVGSRAPRPELLLLDLYGGALLFVGDAAVHADMFIVR